MKIYRFTDLAGHSRAGTAGAHAAYRAHYGQAPRTPGLGEDMVEISPEARMRFEQSRVMQIDRARIRKLVSEYSELVRRHVALEDDMPSRIRRQLAVNGIREAVRRGSYDFDSDTALGDAANSVLDQLLDR